jgi:lipoprotein NlpI
MMLRRQQMTLGMKPSALGMFALAAVVSVAAIAVPHGQAGDARSGLDRAIEDFLAGRISASVAGFDRVTALAPGAAPQLWQRGIALYYVGRYEDCRRQFESHRTVNPDDVENAAWHFLCVARAESPDKARAALLPVGPDPRAPMREIYQMFGGGLSTDAVLAAGRQNASAQFYAALYVGLYEEAHGRHASAIRHLSTAASDKYASAGGYMHRVAVLHPLLARR